MRPWCSGLFAGCDLLTGGDAYRQAAKFTRGAAVGRRGLDSAAPIGVAGSWRFLCHLAKAVGLTLKPGAKSARDAFAAQMAPCADAIRRADVRVGVEGAGWYAYALAGLPQKRIGRACVHERRPPRDIPAEAVCDEFYEDTGRFELVERFRAFGARTVFGSSNVQLDEAWTTCPSINPSGGSWSPWRCSVTKRRWRWRAALQRRPAQ